MSPELLSLLRACKQEPTEDAPRLVLADWLEEHGDAERGWFIRRQCGIDLGPGVPGEKELLQRNGERWGSGGKGAWARGLYAFHGTAEALRRLGPGLLPWAETVRPAGFAPAAAGRWLELLAELSIYSLDLGPTSPEVLTAMAQCPHLAGLRSLTAYGHSFRKSKRALAEGARALLASPHLPRLCRLTLHEFGIGDDEARALAAAPQLAGLKFLWLSGNRIGAKGMMALAASPHFQGLVLGLRGNRLGDKGARALAASPQRWGLASIDLTNNQVGAAGWAALLGWLRPGLIQSLDLSGAGLGDEGARILAASPSLARLTSLSLGSNQIGDDGACALAGSPHLANLTSLSLFDNHIRDKGAKALGGSPHLAGLNSLNLGFNGIGPTGRDALCKSPYLANATLELKVNNF